MENKNLMDELNNYEWTSKERRVERLQLDRKKLLELALPLIQLINEEYLLHDKIIIDCNSVELVSGEIHVGINEQLKSKING